MSNQLTNPAGAPKTLAVLIDADNCSATVIEQLLAEISTYGVASVKRAYGDWTQPNLRGWKDVLLTYAIHPIQQFRYTVGKNSSDSAMIIDAMDLLYTGNFSGFCLVSSDSDFTRLASRIREAGLTVYGFGERKTPSALVNACDKFVYTEILCQEGKKAEEPGSCKLDLKSDAELIKLIKTALDAVADEDGWAHLGGVGQQISIQSPSFDARNYGFKKLGELVRALDLFEIDERTVDERGRKSVYIRHRLQRRPLKNRPARNRANGRR
ncbi:MAG: NYN domain protein [Deltaproteobacteria bacterium ADurb.Bin510]|nr:MAG: NYN domain protein [Deltaproteobacteria bacterium ADurb.Bin510]